MKLLYCKNCHDIIKLLYTPRFCRCGKVGGEYLNILDIAVYGEKKLAVPIGIHNSSFYKAIENQPKEDLGDNGEVFLSFIIPEECRKVDFRKKEDIIERILPRRFDINFTKDDEFLALINTAKELRKKLEERIHFI